MKFKHFIFGFGASLAALVIGIATVQTATPANFLASNSTQEEYSLLLDSSKTPSTLTPTNQLKVMGEVISDFGNHMTLGFSNARTESGAFVRLAYNGMVYNLGSDASQFNGLTGITITLTSGSVTLFTSQFGGPDTAFMGEAIDVTSGVKIDIPSSNTFLIKAGDTGAIIKSIKLDYKCFGTHYDIKQLYGTYSGVGNNNAEYGLTFNSSGVTISSDTLPGGSLSGEAEMISATRAKCTFTYQSAEVQYTVDIQENGRKLAYVEKTGGAAAAVAEVDFYRIYNVEDFESYSQTGQGFDNNNKATNNNTGLRAAYFSNYGSTSTAGYLNGNLMGSPDYLELGIGLGRNGSKAGIVKGNSSTCRFYSIKNYLGIPQAIGKGNILSFFSKKAYPAKPFDEEATKVVSNIEVRAYYTPNLSVATLENCDSKTFTINTNDWSEYKMSLDPSKTYYGIAIYAVTAGTYTPIDDIQIRTLNDRPEGTYSTVVQASGYKLALLITIGSEESGLYHVSFANSENITATSFSYDRATKSLTINTSGSYISLTVGVITAKYDAGNDRIINLGCSGSVKEYIDNGNVTLNRPDYYYNCDGTDTELQSIFKRRWNDGSWKVDGPNGAATNADRIKQYKLNYVTGKSSIRFRSYSSGLAALNLQNDISNKTVGNIGFWVYNTMDTQVLMRVFIYKAANLDSSSNCELLSHMEGKTEVSGVYIPSKTWKYICVGFSHFTVGTNTLYNFQIAFNKATSYPLIDDISLYR